MTLFDRLDKLFYKKDFAGAEAFLLDSAKQFASVNDYEQELICYNELSGIYRKQNLKDKALWAVSCAMELIQAHPYPYNLLGDVYTSLATAYMHFASYDNAMELFDKAKVCYEYYYKKPTLQMATLLNNMGLCYMAIAKLDIAVRYFKQSVIILETLSGYPLELAMSYISLAEAMGDAECDELYTKAFKCFDSPLLKRDGYYAFVAEKCLPSFERNGYFRAKLTLEKRIASINEGLRAK